MEPPPSDPRQRRSAPDDPQLQSGVLTYATQSILAGAFAATPLWIGLGMKVFPPDLEAIVAICVAIATLISAKLQVPEDTFMALFPISLVVALLLRAIAIA